MQKSFSLLHSNSIFNLYRVYELNIWVCNLTNNSTLKNCLFAAVKLTRKADKSKFTYMVKEQHSMEKVPGVFIMTVLEML